jgi:hypothetical protein
MFYTRGVSNPELERSDLLADAENLPHGAATVPAAPAIKCHWASLCSPLVFLNGKPCGRQPSL